MPEILHWWSAMILLAPHLAAFLQQRLPIERRASPNTCDSYAHAFSFCSNTPAPPSNSPPSQLQLEQLDAPLIVNFLNHLETNRGNAAGSRNIRLAAIKSFMHYMEYRVHSALEQIQRILAIPAKKTDTRLVRHLTAQEMQSILDGPDPTLRDGIRDRAMLHLCFAGGLRVSELVGLRIEDVVLQPQASVLIHGKGRKERLPATMERNFIYGSCMAVCPGRGPEPRAIPECAEGSHDPRRFRIHPAQACPCRSNPLSYAFRQEGFTACA
jgi:integrase/recombinase XerD